MPAFKMSKKSLSYSNINTGSHLGFHSDWEDWVPFWSADMALQARRKAVSCKILGGNRRGIIIYRTHSLWFFTSVKLKYDVFKQQNVDNNFLERGKLPHQ